MPDSTSQLGTVQGITKALLDALDQIHTQVSAGFIGPDGKPSGTALYMHMPVGIPVDPKMFANPWTPAGGDSGSQFGNDGSFSGSSAPASSPPPAGVPSGSVYPPPAKPDPQLANSIQAAYFTSRLVDQMMLVTKNGIFSAWPDRNVNVEYFTIVKGMQPIDQSPPAQDVLNRVAAAQAKLFVQDASGNPIGYTPLYANYRRNHTAWTTAISKQAMAYAQAMADPVLGQQWPVVAGTYADAVTQARSDLEAMGRQTVEDALAIIATQGEGAVTALADMARKLYDAYQLQLAGGVSAGVPWSYVSPMSWWDSTDDSFGAIKVTGSSKNHDASTAQGAGSFANNWHQQQSESTRGGGGFNVGLYSAHADAKHSDDSNASGNHADQYNWSNHTDHSSSATVTFEYFLASIERPWFLGDLFNIKGWYLVGQRANSISDGTIDNQIGEKATAILPMLPKGFLVIRNVSITCDDWGDFGTAFHQAQQASQGSGQSSANSMAVSGSYLFVSASGSHQDEQSSDSFGRQQTSSGFTFESDGRKGGTLTMMGSQIAGWIGQIQAAAPLMDDPTLPKPKAGGAGAPATG